MSITRLFVFVAVAALIALAAGFSAASAGGHALHGAAHHGPASAVYPGNP